MLINSSFSTRLEQANKGKLANILHRKYFIRHSINNNGYREQKKQNSSTKLMPINIKNNKNRKLGKAINIKRFFNRFK